MKTKLFNTALIAIALIIGFAACKKDEKVKNNSFLYNQKEAAIGSVMGFEYGQSPVAGIYGIEVDFLENTLVMHYTNNFPDSVSGMGDILILVFLTNKIDEISPGVYNYLTSNAPLQSFSIYGDGESGLEINMNPTNGTQPGYAEINGGNVTVNKSGEEYEFTFDLKTNLNTTITGYYKGKITLYTDYKKKSAHHQNWFPKPLSDRK